MGLNRLESNQSIVAGKSNTAAVKAIAPVPSQSTVTQDGSALLAKRSAVT